ncbi:MAG: hypothetical protein HYY16_06325 [Planctomycetes bacterium]|nr:hypothetical protein [Planctomycetota bacterium]
MILTALMLFTAAEWPWEDGHHHLFQEETGVPIEPFSGLEGGIVYARFPRRHWGLTMDAEGGWSASTVLGGATFDDGVQFMARLTYRQWEDMKIDEANEVAMPDTDAELRIQGAIADLSIDAGIGPLRFGATLGGGLYLLKHRFERDLAPTGEGGFYLRIVPVSWLYVEGGALATGLRNDFNREDNRTDVVPTGYAVAGFELRF